MTPDVVLVRDLSNHSVTLTWSPPPNTPSPIVYVVQEKEESGPRHLRHWAEAHLVSPLSTRSPPPPISLRCV